MVARISMSRTMQRVGLYRSVLPGRECVTECARARANMFARMLQQAGFEILAYDHDDFSWSQGHVAALHHGRESEDVLLIHEAFGVKQVA